MFSLVPPTKHRNVQPRSPYKTPTCSASFPLQNTEMFCLVPPTKHQNVLPRSPYKTPTCTASFPLQNTNMFCLVPPTKHQHVLPRSSYKKKKKCSASFLYETPTCSASFPLQNTNMFNLVPPTKHQNVRLPPSPYTALSLHRVYVVCILYAYTFYCQWRIPKHNFCHSYQEKPTAMELRYLVHPILAISVLA